MSYFSIVDQIKRNDTALKEVELSGKKIDDKKAIEIFKALEKNTNLLRLYLNDNQLTDDCVKSICDSLSLNSTLDILEIDGNILTDDGITLFIKLLSKNKGLTDVLLQEDATDDQLDDMDEILDRNFEEKKKKKVTVVSKPVEVKPVTPKSVVSSNYSKPVIESKPISSLMSKFNNPSTTSPVTPIKPVSVVTKSPVVTPKVSTFETRSPVSSISPVLKPVSSPVTPVKVTEQKSPESPVMRDPVEKPRDGESRRRVKRSSTPSQSPKTETVTKVVVDEKAMEAYRIQEREREKKKKELEDKLKALERDKQKAIIDHKAKQSSSGPPLEFSKDEISKTMEYLAIADESSKGRK